MSFKKISPEDKTYFLSLLSSKRVSDKEDIIAENSHDHTEDFAFFPDLVLFPETTEEIAQILCYCNEQHICVTPRGAGTGLSGGSIPLYGGISLDFRRMNKIISIDEENYQVTIEPGVITEVLQETLQAKGLFYPVDPASRGSCFIGGNIAENSGGPRAVKYGTVKDYVLNLEIVLPDGSIIQTGANTLKNATGYDLTRLIVGSEGTLAVVTRITLRLLPYPSQRMLLLAPFSSAEIACKAVNAILQAGITPSALEFMEREALLCAQAYLGESPIIISEKTQAHLLIETDGNHKDILFQQMEAITKILSGLTEEENMLLAENQQQQDVLWRLRRVVGEAAKSNSIYKEEDTVVPRAYLPELLRKVKSIGQKYGFQSICYGHAGDGNLHVNILKGKLTEHQWKEEVPKGIQEIFRFVIEKGGTISGEHGIGFIQKDYMPLVFPNQALELMRSIKKVFDPRGILNPGKVFPDA